MREPYNVSMVVIEGSSTAYGYYDAQLHGWANRLRTDVLAYNGANDSTPIVIDNRAIPGMTISAINRELTTHLAAQAQRSHQLSSVLSVGINESKVMPGCTRPVVPLTVFRLGVQHFVRRSEQHKARAVLVGPQPPAEDQFTSVTTGSIIEADLTEEYSEVMRQVAEETGSPFVDVYDLFGDTPEQYLSDDKIHPNALGHTMLHGAIARELQVIGAM